MHLDIDLHTIIRRILLQETFDANASNVGDVLSSSPRLESDPNSESCNAM